MKIERSGAPDAIAENISAAHAGGMIRDLADEADATVTLSGSRPTDGMIMIAISNGKYFLGLFSPKGEIHQYVATGNERLQASTTFTIQGERTSIESRYVVDARTAATVIQEWVAGGRVAASSGHWMKM